MMTQPHNHPISKDTQLCMSLSARPSNFGTRFHNYLYQLLDQNYIYKGFSTTDLEGAVRGIRALNIRGCAISMPFKEAVIPLLDELDFSAKVIDSVNTIVNDNGFLRAYNTDFVAVAKLLEQVPNTYRFALRGSGGMSKAVAFALREADFKGVIVARNEAKGRALAQAAGFAWQPDMQNIKAELLINATPIGMSDGPESQDLAFTAQEIAQAHTIFDVVAVPPQTPLILEAQKQGKHIISGAEVIILQAVEQFVLYTGIRPTQAQIAEAAQYALS